MGPMSYLVLARKWRPKRFAELVGQEHVVRALSNALDSGRVIGVEALGVGLGTSAFVAFIARATHPAYTATQFALFTSLAAVPRTFINASAGWLVENLGWFTFFELCVLLALPGMLLLPRVAPWNEEPPLLAKG